MCGLPGERETDLDGIIEMAETISRLGKEVSGRLADGGGQRVELRAQAADALPVERHAAARVFSSRPTSCSYRRKRLRSVQLKCHDVETSLLEGVMCRGDRRVGAAIELAWRRGARFDAWAEQAQPALWWQALADTGIDVEQILHLPALPTRRCPGTISPSAKAASISSANTRSRSRS